MTAKTLLRTIRKTEGHWVGDGFPVVTMFSYNDRADDFSPFLLLDHAGPATFEAGLKPLGVGMHPHRGFETVTVVYDGEVAHKDTAGHSGVVGRGDVQWMTAGRGVLHEEMHSEDFTARGGALEMVQLWVNLPARDKMTAPRYQDILQARIPVHTLPDGAGHVRVIAGAYHDITGPALTFTPVHLFDASLRAGAVWDVPVRDGFNTLLLVRKGDVQVEGADVPARDLAVFSRDGDTLHITARTDCEVLVMAGEPIKEPVGGRGPFVMNTMAEIQQAFADFQSGRF